MTFNSLTHVSNKLHAVSELFEWRFSNFFLARESWKSKNCKKRYLCWLCTIFKLSILKNHRIELVHQRLKQKNQSRRGIFNWKIIDFVTYIRNLILWKLHKVLSLYRDSNSYISVITNLKVLENVTSMLQFYREGYPSKKSLILFPHLDNPKISNLLSVFILFVLQIQVSPQLRPSFLASRSPSRALTL